MQLNFDADVEAFRAEFVAFLNEHLPTEAEATERSRTMIRDALSRLANDFVEAGECENIGATPD